MKLKICTLALLTLTIFSCKTVKTGTAKSIDISGVGVIHKPLIVDLDYEELSKTTENYVSSDIKFLCDETSRMPLKTKSRISKQILLQTIEANKPSIYLNELYSYNAIKAKREGKQLNRNEQQKIGFKK